METVDRRLQISLQGLQVHLDPVVLHSLGMPQSLLGRQQQPPTFTFDAAPGIVAYLPLRQLLLDEYEYEEALDG